MAKILTLFGSLEEQEAEPVVLLPEDRPAGTINYFA